MANQAANTARLYIYDGLANLMTDTAVRRTGVISGLGTIQHLASTHVAAYGGYAFITSFGQTWLRTVPITGSSTANVTAGRWVTVGRQQALNEIFLNRAGIGDGPGGVWLNVSPLLPANRTITEYRIGDGGTPVQPPNVILVGTGRERFMDVGPDDFVTLPEYGWRTSDQRNLSLIHI